MRGCLFLASLTLVSLASGSAGAQGLLGLLSGGGSGLKVQTPEQRETQLAKDGLQAVERAIAAAQQKRPVQLTALSRESQAYRTQARALRLMHREPDWVWDDVSAALRIQAALRAEQCLRALARLRSAWAALDDSRQRLRRFHVAYVGARGSMAGYVETKYQLASMAGLKTETTSFRKRLTRLGGRLARAKRRSASFKSRIDALAKRISAGRRALDTEEELAARVAERRAKEARKRAETAAKRKKAQEAARRKRTGQPDGDGADEPAKAGPPTGGAAKGGAARGHRDSDPDRTRGSRIEAQQSRLRSRLTRLGFELLTIKARLLSIQQAEHQTSVRALEGRKRLLAYSLEHLEARLKYLSALGEGGTFHREPWKLVDLTKDVSEHSLQLLKTGGKRIRSASTAMVDGVASLFERMGVLLFLLGLALLVALPVGAVFARGKLGLLAGRLAERSGADPEARTVYLLLGLLVRVGKDLALLAAHWLEGC